MKGHGLTVAQQGHHVGYHRGGNEVAGGQVFLNRAFGTNLSYRAMSVEDYKADRIAELGEFIGTVISGIYQGIRDGALDNPSDFTAAVGRPHQSWDAYFGTIAKA